MAEIFTSKGMIEESLLVFSAGDGDRHYGHWHDGICR